MKEFNIAKSLNHTNIVNAEEFFFNKQLRKLVFIFEYFEGENLYQLLIQNKLANLTCIHLFLLLNLYLLLKNLLTFIK